MLTKNSWGLELGKYTCILSMKREPANSLDIHALSVVKPNDMVVGHIPYNMAVISSFLAKDCNKGSREIIGKRVNLEAGCLEVPCILSTSCMRRRSIPSI